MFEEATRLHFSLKCSVGGGSREVMGKLYGMGCRLDHEHVLTARHVWREIQERYAWPVALTDDGLYKCKPVFEQHDADLLVLRATELLEEVNSDKPIRYPKISSKPVFLGKTVGYLATLNIRELESSRTYFSTSSLSMLMGEPGRKGLRIAMTGGLIQKGFSGGPVFDEEGDVLGVLVQSLRFPLDPDVPHLSITTMPIMSALFPFRDEIVSLLTM